MEPEKKPRKRKPSDSEETKMVKKKNKTVKLETVEEDVENENEINIENPIENGEKLEDIAGADEGTEETWTPEDYRELIKRIEMQIPKNDNLSFGSRALRLKWEEIQFGDHTAEECFEKWKFLKSKVRHFRLLSEILDDAKIWVEKPWSAPNKKKKGRHPDQPARPLSSFMLYYMEKKSKIMKRHPDLKLTEISRMIGEKFKKLPDEKKNYYVEKAKEMQEEYKQNLAKFHEKHPELIPVSKKPVQNNKPLPPFKVFLNEKLLKHQKDDNFNQAEFIEKYKEVWKSLSYKKKAYWIRKAKEEEEKYLDHLREEEGEGEENKLASYKSIISKEEQSILDKMAGKPEKPPNSAYSLFSRLMLQDKDHNLVDGEPKNRMKEVAAMWKELPEDQRKMYAERVQHMHEHYKLEMANYLETLPEDKRAEELAKLQPKKKAARVRQKPAKKAVPEKFVSDDGEELWKNEPKKPPVTAWDLFKNEFVKKNSHLPSKAAFKQAAAQWKTLSKKEIEKYKKRHQKMKDKYMADFEVFLTTLNEDELKEYSAWKKAAGQRTTEESGEEDSSEEEEEEEEDEEEEEEEEEVVEDEDEDGNHSSASLSNSSDSDSGVSEADV